MDSIPLDCSLDRIRKKCADCRRLLPVAAFYARSEGGVKWICKECFAERARLRYVLSRPQPIQLPFPSLEKECSNCKSVLALDQFAERADHPGKRKSHCNSCRNAAKKDYKRRNREKVRASDQRYYRENADKVADSHRTYRTAHPEKYKTIHSKWKSENKEAVNASTHKRRARIKAGGSWTKADWQRLKATYAWRCLGCGLQEITDGITLCFDHIIPLSLGGWNLITNGQPLCRSCNSLKHRKVLDLRDRSYPFKK